MTEQETAKTVTRQVTWVWRGLAVVLVGTGSVFIYAGFPYHLAPLVIGACLTLTGIFLAPTR